MSTLKTIAFLFITIVTSASAVMGQTDKEVTDNELKQFVAIVQQIQSINQESQQQMIKVVEDKGLNVERFNEIAQATQDPNKENDASDEEMKKFTDISTTIEKMYAGVQKKIEDNIKTEGLTLERYQEIGTAIQTKPELQERIQKFIEN